jgi:UrcA family protein
MNTNVKTSHRMSATISTALLLMCACAFSGAFAGEQVRSERVKFQDLNIDTPEGVQALYGRIHSAALRVCSETDPILRQAAGACALKSEQDAIRKLDLPQLSAYYKVKTKRGEQAERLAAAR